MGDLISRQEAINIIENYPHGEWNVETMNDVIGKIKSLPSAEPWVTEEMVDSYVKPRHLRVISEELYLHLTAGKYLPPPIFQPTQPERKTGKWIKQTKFGRLECDVCGHVFKTYFRPRNFCPNCGADMRGEVNRNDQQ